MSKHIVAGLVVMAMVLPMVGSAATIEELRAEIQSLQAKIAEIRQLLISNGTSEGGGRSGPRGVTVEPARPIDVRPFPIENFPDAAIVQFNNLAIQQISGGTFPVTIVATSDVAIKCLRFEELQSALGVAFPCSGEAASHQITVDARTILLLRNRTRASLSDFAVGDRINVYGFVDRKTRSIEALILRNLDKPSSERLIQLNNLEVLAAPDSNTPPASFIAIRSIASPCLEFPTAASARGLSIACPLGRERFEEPMRSMPPMTPDGRVPASYYEMPRKYQIHVSENTTLLNRERQPIRLADIQVGDRVNVYGSIDQNGNVRGIIVRDLSKPVLPHPGGVSISSIEPSRGVIGTTVVLRGSGFVGFEDAILQSYPTQIRTSGNTVHFGHGVIRNVVSPDGETLTFTVPESLNPACLYSVPACAMPTQMTSPGEYKIWVENRNGSSNAVMFVVTGDSTGEVRIETKSNLLAVVGKAYNATFFGAGGTSGYSFALTGGSLPPGLTLVVPPMPMFYCPDQGASSPFNCKWPGATSVSIKGTPERTGQFKFILTATDANGRSGSTAFVITVRDGGVVNGSLSIEPSSVSLRVGQATSVRSFYNNCPRDAVCIAGPLQVNSIWSSSNLAIASVSCLDFATQAVMPVHSGCSLAEVTARSPGTAEIQAVHAPGDGSAKVVASATVTVESSAGPSFTVTTDKESYNANEEIHITLTAKNPTASPITFDFNSGCQVYYRIAGFVSSIGMACTLAFTSVAIPPGESKSWALIHSPTRYHINPGVYELTGHVIGYGSAVTKVTIK